MAIPNQTIEAENTAHPAGATLDPFAVDFFGGASSSLDHEEVSAEKARPHRLRRRHAKGSDWHKSLPRITNAEAEISNRLSNLPENISEAAARLIGETVARYTFQTPEKVDCSVVSVREANLEQAFRALDESPKVYLTIGSPTAENSAVAALDVDFASAVIDSMLETGGAPRVASRQLSPVETTIIEFLAANLLREINEFAGESMLSLRNSKTPPAGSFETARRGAEFVLSLSAGQLSGFVYFLAPHGFLKALERSHNPLLDQKNGRRNFSDYEKIARALRLRLEIGTTRLDAESLLSLEPDDIVLVEQPRIRPGSVEIGGKLTVYAGSGTNFRLRGTAEAGAPNGSLNFRIEEIISEEARRKFTPAKFKMDEKETAPAEETAFETDAPEAENTDEDLLDEQLSPSLENIQVALRVEIAGDRISLRELQNLRAGQIIALGCAPTDPVRLLTDNSEEPVATGELVEIEGQLGVRLTKVFI